MTDEKNTLSGNLQGKLDELVVQLNMLKGCMPTIDLNDEKKAHAYLDKMEAALDFVQRHTHLDPATQRESNFMDEVEYKKLRACQESIKYLKDFLSDYSEINTVLIAMNNILNQLFRELYLAQHTHAYLEHQSATNRVGIQNNLLMTLNIIAHANMHDLNACLNKQKQALVDAYYQIRKSAFGSEGKVFGSGSRLGDRLEKFMQNELGINVPHRVNERDVPPQFDIAHVKSHAKGIN